MGNGIADDNLLGIEKRFFWTVEVDESTGSAAESVKLFNEKIAPMNREKKSGER